MLAAVDLYDQFDIETGEIGDVGTDWDLPAKLDPVELATAKFTAEPILGLRHIAPQTASELAFGGRMRGPAWRRHSRLQDWRRLVGYAAATNSPGRRSPFRPATVFLATDLPSR
jgi:hypothetical protein